MAMVKGFSVYENTKIHILSGYMFTFYYVLSGYRLTNTFNILPYSSQQSIAKSQANVTLLIFGFSNPCPSAIPAC